jgi:predicted Zn-dependent peptidase
VEGITEYALPAGLRVLLFPALSKPKVTVNMTYLIGSRLEGSGENGLAHLMEHMVFKQTKGGRDVAKELSDHGADFNGTTTWDRTNYFETVTAIDENLRWAIGLEADRMVNMRMEKALLDKEMTVVRNEFESGENNPVAVFAQRVLSAAYTAHNYGRPTLGNRSDIENVPIERLAAFYRKYYQPDDVILTIAGKFDEPKALAWVAESFAAVPRPQRTLEKSYTVEPTQDGERFVTLRRVGDNQNIMVIYHSPAASHPASLELGRHFTSSYPRGDVHYAATPDEQIEDLKKVTLDDVRKFYAQFYGASNADLVVAGQFDKEEVRKLAADLFGDWKSPGPYQRVLTPYRKIEPMDRKIETPDKQNATFLAAMFIKFSDDDPDYPAMLLANYMLGGSPGARLFKRTRVTEGLSYGVQSMLQAPTKDDGGTFAGMAISAPQNAPKVEASFKDELARTLKDGFTAEEVAAAKKAWLDDQAVARSQDQVLAGTLSRREFYDRTMKFDEALEAKVAALTPEQVLEAFRRHVGPSNLSYVKAGDFKKAGVFQE